MGLRYRKSVKIAPGTKLNFSKSSIGVTSGSRGAHVSMNSSGRVSASAGVPGSGLSYTTSSGGTKRKNGCLIPIIAFLAFVGFIFYGFSSCISSSSRPKSPVLNNDSHNSGTRNPDSATTTISVDPADAERRTQALESIENFLADQGFEVVEAKKAAKSLSFSVHMPGVSDSDNLSSAPSNWEEVKETIMAASDEAAKSVSDLYSGGIVIYLQNSSGENLLTLLNSKISYDKFEAGKQTPNSDSGAGNERRVWVTDGGDKYHAKSTCSNMKDPYTLPVSEAIFSGYTACDKCS